MAESSIFLAEFIDHTLLRPDAIEPEIDQLCTEARQHGFFGVCVQPVWVGRAAKNLGDSDIKVVSVVGFPSGASLTATKVFETRAVRAMGAQEIDVVINLGWLKAGTFTAAEDEIAEIVRAAEGAPVKIILETGLLTDTEIVQGCELSIAAGAVFVKTSTGFAKIGATPHAVALMRKSVGGDFGVKASGGIRTLAEANAMLSAGANRLGCSNSVAIVAEADQKKAGYPERQPSVE
jgi:deoxyribose-phosphate aldolase